MQITCRAARYTPYLARTDATLIRAAALPLAYNLMVHGVGDEHAVDLRHHYAYWSVDAPARAAEG